jgi:hypothetical protein
MKAFYNTLSVSCVVGFVILLSYKPSLPLEASLTLSYVLGWGGLFFMTLAAEVRK